MPRARTEALDRVVSLVERARAGDLAAFEQLAERYLPEVYRLAAAMVGEDDARDVAQDALLATWRQLPRLHRVEKFEPWLRSIVMNRARNTLRARRRHPTVGLIEGHGALLVHEPAPAIQRRIDLEASLGALQPDHREVVALHYVLDLPLREVAEVLGIREGTAKSRLHAALQALRVEAAER